MEVIGFIGLGIMGKPMALNLIKAGHSLVVQSRSRKPVDELVAAGAKAAATPALTVTTASHRRAVHRSIRAIAGNKNARTK